MNKIRGLKMLSVKFSFFQGFFSENALLYGHLNFKIESNFFGETVGTESVNKEPKIVFYCGKLLKTSNLRKNRILNIPFKTKIESEPTPPPPLKLIPKVVKVISAVVLHSLWGW